MKTLLAALIPAVLAGLPGSALAHSFNLALVVPLTGIDAADGRAARDGLMLATRERDAHPAETSDGHLGGLDSHVTVIDSAGGAGTLAERVLREVQAEGLDIVAAVLPPDQAAALAAALAASAAVFCPPGEPGAADAFAATFEAEYGRAPEPAAILGYAAGRAIDRAVRAQGGVSDRVALADLCAGGE